MVKVKPFAAIRPPKAIAKEVSARPYDVMNSVEAKAEAGEKSLLHITKPEIDFDPIAGEHEARTYDRAVENFRRWQDAGWLVRDPQECYYVYAQTMGERTQYGLVLCAHTDDYAQGRIKKHELTRKDKEDDRMVHVRIQSANIEPVFFAYKDHPQLNALVARAAAGAPEYDFTDENGFRHRFWPILDPDVIRRITALFTAEVEAFYVADGHHRTAAAARVGAELKAQNPHHTGQEEYNWFMAVCFPQSQLKIIDYNRVVKDLAGLSPDAFLAALEEDFIVRLESGPDGTPTASANSRPTSPDPAEPFKAGGGPVPSTDRPVGPGAAEPFAPQRLHQFSMYLEGRWYSLTTREGRYDDTDPIGVLDVTVLSRLVLDKILGIKDLRTDKRIDFVGGIRGLGELARRVDSGEMKVAFALYPVSMQQLMDIADSGAIMPPKTTWFEPKLRSGLAIHTF